MNFALYYFQRNKPNLAASVFELLLRKGLSGGGYTDRINEFVWRYQSHLIGFERCNKMHKCLPGIVNEVHPYAVSLIYQRLLIIIDFIREHELYEMLPRFWKINEKLATEIKKLRPDMDVTPLSSEADLEQFRKDMMREIKIYYKTLD